VQKKQLYKLKRLDRRGYDIGLEAVVRASTSREARRLVAEHFEESLWMHEQEASIEVVEVEGPSLVIVSSFRHG